MLDSARGERSPVSDFVRNTTLVENKPRALKPQATLVLRSRLPGRERWYVDVLEDNPRLAAAVELILRSEPGIEEAMANPLTGRVLARWRRDSISEPIETMIRRAIQAGPLSPEEFAAFQAEQAPSSFSNPLLTAEIACSLSHLILFGGLCPLGLAATGVLLLAHRRPRAHAHR